MHFCFILSPLTHFLQNQRKFCRFSTVDFVSYVALFLSSIAKDSNSSLCISQNPCFGTVLSWCGLPLHMLTSDSHTFCPCLASHRGRDLSAMTHNHFCLLCFLPSQCKERYFWHFFAYWSKNAGLLFPAYLCIAYDIWIIPATKCCRI